MKSSPRVPSPVVWLWRAAAAGGDEDLQGVHMAMVGDHYLVAEGAHGGGDLLIMPLPGGTGR